MAINDKAYKVGFRREIGDESNPTFSIVIGGTSNALHLIDPLNAGTDFNVSAGTTPTLYIHGSAAAPTEYVKIYTDETDGYVDVTGANLKLVSDGNIVLEPLHTTGFVKIAGTASWVVAGTCTITAPATAGPLGLKGSAISEWLKVENKDGSARYVAAYA